MRKAIAATFLALLCAETASAERIPDRGGPAALGPAQPCLSDEQRHAIKAGPHLHFELYDPADALIDPYFGPCNTPNGVDWATWTGTAGITYAAYWYYWWTLPVSPPLGRWNFRAVYQSVTYNHGFNVLAVGDPILRDGFPLGL